MRFDILSRVVLSTLVLAAASSCARELSEPEMPESRIVTRTLDAVISEDDTDSKTSLSHLEDKFVLSWSNKDKIKIFSKTDETSATASIISGTDYKRARFTAELNEGEQYYASYPYSISANLKQGAETGDYVEMSLPSSQSGLAKDATVMLAKEGEGYLHFKNVSSVLAIKVNSNMYPDASKLRVETLDVNESLAGTFRVQFDEFGDVAVTPAKNGSPSIVIQLPEASWANHKDVYATIIPQRYSRGLKISILRSNGTTIRTITCERTIFARPGSVVNFDKITNHLDEYLMGEVESFDACEGVGAYDGNFSIAGDRLPEGLGAADSKTVRQGWNFTNCYEALGCIRVGDNVSQGSASLPLNIESGRATVSFYSAVAGVAAIANVFLEGEGVISSHTFESRNGAWKYNTIRIMNAGRNTRLRFVTDADWRGAAPSRAFYIDNIKVVDGIDNEFEYLNIPGGYHYIVGAEETEREIIIRSSGTETIGTPSPSGQYTLPFVKSKVLHTKNGVNCVFEANPTKDVRENWISIDAHGIGSLRFYIHQLGLIALKSSKDALEFSKEGGSEAVTLDLWNFADGAALGTPVSDNSQFEASLEGNTLTVTAKANNTKDPVNGTITISVSGIPSDPAYDNVTVERTCVINITQEHGVVDWDMGFESDEYTYVNGDESFVSPVLVVNEPLGEGIAPAYSIVSDVEGVDVATIDPANGTLSFLGVDGTATVSAVLPSDEYHNETTKSYKLVVSGYIKQQTIAFATDLLEIYAAPGINDGVVSSPYTLPSLIEPAKTSISYSIAPVGSSPAIATIDAATGALTLNGAAGSAIVTATAAEENGWSAASASYTLTVKAMLRNTAYYCNNNPDCEVPTLMTGNSLEYQTANYTLNISDLTGTGFVNKNGFRVTNGSTFTLTPNSGKHIAKIRLVLTNYAPNITNEQNLQSQVIELKNNAGTVTGYYLDLAPVVHTAAVSFKISRGDIRVKEIIADYYTLE